MSGLQQPRRSACFRCNALTTDFRTCTACGRQTPLRRVWIATKYDAYVKELIRVFKYERARAAHMPLAELIRQTVIARDYDVIVPVPVASHRFRLRGYNQSHLLARQLAKAWSLPLATPLLRLSQARQVGHNGQERLAQLQTAFYVHKPSDVAGKSILLVDDVMTTGATLDQCAKTLKTASAAHVEAAVIAR